ncbi:MAG: glycoside hydrolase family 3 N-terminal domain-containing protein [Propioniciclava sp.]|uniref:glycoside hydrolase family 3 protein n=1 Tax=Propioniciclava sp. TaxID=2038686 RepID=UPI0039E5DFED
MNTPDLATAINATLMPGFTGPELPGWLADQLGAGLGSVCLFGSNVTDRAQLAALTGAIHAARPATVIAIDEEGGDVTRLHHRDGSPHPSAAYLGRLDETGATERVGRAIGIELRLAGVDLNLAPVADVNSNPHNAVIGVRSFGADPALVARHVGAYIRGLQGAGVAASAKHFPGHGDTTADSHHELPVVGASLEELHARELAPFRAAVAAGSLTVMTSHLLVPVLDPIMPMTLSRPGLTVLRDELGFEGAIISDALDMKGVSAERGIPEAAVLALAAGVDLLCLGTRSSAVLLASIRRHVLDALRDGRLSEARIYQAAGRVASLSAGVAALRRPVPVDAAAFWTRRPLPPLVAPVIVRLASADNMAAGAVPWGIGEHLAGEVAATLPGATCATASDLDALGQLLASHPERPLVVQGRDLHRVEFLAAACAFVRARRPDAVIVDLGWPDIGDGALADVATFGAGRATALTVLGLLARGMS